MNDTYLAKIQHLEWMQAFHRFYLSRGVAVSMVSLFCAEAVALTLEKHGWNTAASAALRLFEVILVGSVVAPICFFVNLLVLREWKCPRCHCSTLGIAQKETHCFDCGLKLSSH